VDKRVKIPVGSPAARVPPADGGRSASELELSIVMPCLNESATVGRCVSKAKAALSRLGIRGEVIVADNGSTDGSVAIAEALEARVIQVERKGYGEALRAGFDAAAGRFVLMGDADDSYDFSEIDGFVDRLRAGDELVMGTRLRGRILPGAMPWKNRYIGNPLLTWMLKRIYGSKVSDAHCGMRAVSKSAYQRMNLRSPGMEFASEMVVKAAKVGLRTSEVPITFHKDGRGRAPHLRPFRDGWRHVKLLLIYSPTALFLVPGGILVSVGVGLMVTQLFAPIDQPSSLLGFRLDFHWAILGSFLTLVGYQLIVIHFFARVYSVTHRLREPDRVLRWALRYLSLNRVLFLASLIGVAGLVLNTIVIVGWLRTDFGPLVSGHTRLFILGSTLLALGIQTIFSAFFFSILGDAYRERPAEARVQLDEQ
jgi:glycosyltransferase involved in cell wall biosynthesis